jgi:hypothetical protein
MLTGGLLWARALRSARRAVPRNELSLLDLPPHHRSAVRRLVQRAALTVQADRRRSDSLRLERPAHPELVPGLRHADHFRARWRGGRNRRHDLQPRRAGPGVAARSHANEQPARLGQARRRPAGISRKPLLVKFNHRARLLRPGAVTFLGVPMCRRPLQCRASLALTYCSGEVVRISLSLVEVGRENRMCKALRHSSCAVKLRSFQVWPSPCRNPSRRK